MKKQLILVAILAVGVFVLSSSVRAANAVEYGLITSTVAITPADLGVDNVGTLPTSPFYFFKQWSRGIQRFFTIDSVAKTELELNITNQTAAELLEVEKTYEACVANALGGGKSCKPEDKVGSVKNALQNFTDAQERLNARTIVIELSEPRSSENARITELLKNINDKTALHVALLEQLTTQGNNIYGDVVWGIIKNAQDNTLKTFTITVSPVNDTPTLKQKAEEQIKRAEVAISEANSAMEDVSTTRGINVNPGGVDARGISGTGTNGGDLKPGVSAVNIDGVEGPSIFDRWGNMIAKAKSNLDNAKKAFADGKYGEAYGQARSAEAMLPVLASGQNFPDARINTTTPTPSPALKSSPKPSASPTARPTPEKTETPASAGSPVR